MEYSTSSSTGDAAPTSSVAATLFASADVTSHQLEVLLCLPWHTPPSTTSTTQGEPPARQSTTQGDHPAVQSTTVPQLSQAKVNALLLLAAAPLLGHSDLSSSDVSSKQGSFGLFHKALQDSDASVQAAATVLLPVVVANAAEAGKGSARGHPTVGVRLLQKGLDALSGVLSSHQEGALPPSGVVQLALAHALGGFVGMQVVVEHRAVALCKAAEALLVLRQCESTASKNSTGSDSSTTSLGEGGWLSRGGLSGLHCWPVPRQGLQELGVTGHAGAALPVKAIRSFADALLSPEQDGIKGLGKVPHVADGWGTPWRVGSREAGDVHLGK